MSQKFDRDVLDGTIDFEEEALNIGDADIEDAPPHGPRKADETDSERRIDPDAVPFVHLHVHSDYSLLDGAGKIDALIARAQELGCPALALTDHGNMHGVLEFYQKACAVGIKPIVGFEAYIAPKHRTDRSTGQKESNYHLTLLAMNRVGFQNLILLSSRAFREGFYYKPRIDKELLTEYADGLICLSGCVSGEVPRQILSGDGGDAAVATATETARWYKKLFGDRYYIELQDHGLEVQRVVLPHLVKIARDLEIPTVATNDVHYVRREDSEVQDILLCLNTGKFRTDADRLRMESDQFYLRSGREMLAALPGHADAVHRTVEIAARCELELEFGKRFFPNFTPPNGMSSDEYLRQMATEGLKKQYAKRPDRYANGVFSAEVTARIDRELSVIGALGFPNYFLIVWDIVRFAEERGIHRTARGSGVGALVCYALGLSHVCPLDFDLLFERFLDENRREAPDIDIDFDQQRRSEILDYVKEKYGEANVAQIGTFMTMGAKSAIKDVGRVLGLPLAAVTAVTNIVSDAPNTTLKKTFQEKPEFQRIYDTDRDVHELIDYAMKIEGGVRSASTHACAVVISERPLTDFVPIHRPKGEGDDVTQWAAADVEAAGLLKMDFLGLRNLSVLANTIDLIEYTTGTRIDPYRFPLDDTETFALLCRGETKGIFQLEGGGIRELLTRMKPDHFRDIIATVALYRPGPLEGGMVRDYIDVKHGRQKAVYAHPVMRDVLEETHGIMVYQEQIMRILNRLGNVPLADAYSAIKAISKKKEYLIQKNREDFVLGAQENGLPESNAREIFGLIEKFAGYGFNKSHSTAYAKIAYITAYLKAHYPAEFMAALLNGDLSQRNFEKKDSTVEHLDDCRRMGLEVLPPDVNHSFDEYRVLNEKITFSLSAIKGCGTDAIAELVRVRDEGGAYQNLFDLCERVDLKAVSRAAVGSLIKAGALDSFGMKRSVLFTLIDKAYNAGRTAKSDRQRGQKSLFEEFHDEPTGPEEPLPQETDELPELPEWDAKERGVKEKEVLGFYLTGHPMTAMAEKFKVFTTHSMREATRSADRTDVVLGGIISSIKLTSTKKPKPGQPSQYAMFDLEDTQNSIRAILWPQSFAEYGERVKPDAMLLAVGRIDRSRSQNEEDANLIVDRLLTLDEAESQLTRGLRVILSEEKGAEQVRLVYEIAKKYRIQPSGGASPNGGGGGGDLEICIRFKDGRTGILTGDRYRVEIDSELIDRLSSALGAENCQMIPATRSIFSRKSEGENGKKPWKKPLRSD